MKNLEEYILHDSVERLQHGEPLEEILKRYPEARDLRSLLESASLAQSLQSGLQVPYSAQIRSRVQFLEAARKWEQHPPRPFKFSFGSRGIVVLVALFVIMFGVVGSGIVSAKSLPGEPFYPLKVAAEQTRLWMTLNPANRLTLEMTYEQRRLQDVENLINSQQSSHVQVSFSGFLKIKGSDWFVENVPVILPPNMVLNQDIQPGAFVDVTGMTGSKGTVLIEKMNIHEVDFSGQIQSIQGVNWVIGGVDFIVSGETRISGTPAVGAVVDVKAHRIEGNVLEARALVVTDALSAQHTEQFNATRVPIMDTLESEQNTPENDQGSSLPVETELSPTTAVETPGPVETTAEEPDHSEDPSDLTPTKTEKPPEDQKPTEGSEHHDKTRTQTPEDYYAASPTPNSPDATPSPRYEEGEHKTPTPDQESGGGATPTPMVTAQD